MNAIVNPHQELFNSLNTTSLYTTAIPVGVTIILGELPFPAAIQDGCIHVPFNFESELHDHFSRQREQCASFLAPYVPQPAREVVPV
jgi:hypothetical protein